MSDNEFFAAKKEELKEGEKKEIEINDTKILLAKVDGKFYAVGAVCPHYKGPLVKGALCGTKLYCPWHHSAFDITNGKLCEPPSIDGLPTYNIVEKNDDIYIQVRAKETSYMQNEKLYNEKTFVILGGGAAGLMAAQTLRQQGFGGKLIIITRDSELPYDRTALSKKYLSGKQKEEELLLRKKDFFEANHIEALTNKEVKKADTTNKQLLFSDGSFLSYDTLLIASGSEPRKLDIEGAEKKNVFTLRSEDDAIKLLELAKKVKKVCIIGASFIAMETAASLKTLGLDVTVIAKEKLPFEKNFGEAVGRMFLKMHTEKGIVIKTEAEVEKIEGKDNAEALILKSGKKIETELVIVGIGVQPNTDFIEGITLNDKDKSVLINEYFEAADDCFAAGDIARYKNANTNELIRIEHWRVAQQQGRLAAMNMLHKAHTTREFVPFFWTNQFEKRLSYVGHVESWDQIITDGNVDEQSFLSFYIKDNKVLAVASMNRDADSNKIEDIMLKEGVLTIEALQQKLKQ